MAQETLSQQSDPWYDPQSAALDNRNRFGNPPDPLLPQFFSDVLDTTQLTEPYAKLIAKRVADDLNSQSSPQFVDLDDRIADIILETSAQGASIVEVHIVDPQLILLRSDFISVDEDGSLWPPIDITFPPTPSSHPKKAGNSNFNQYRLAAVRFQTVDQGSDANLTLTFEDKTVAQLREVDGNLGGVKMSQPNETLGQFMQILVDAAAHAMGETFSSRLLVDQSKDINATQTPASLSGPGLQTSIGSNIGPLTSEQQKLVDKINSIASGLFGGTSNKRVQASLTDIEGILSAAASGVYDAFAPGTPLNPNYPPGTPQNPFPPGSTPAG